MTSGVVARRRGMRRAARLAASIAVTGTLAGCIEPLPPFVEGSLHLTVVTTGGDFDLDGYTLRLDGAPLADLDVNQTLRLEALSVGAHTVELAGVAPNCTVEGDNPRTVTIDDGATVDVSFDVTCVVTGLWIVITSTGADLPPTYTITVDGGAGVAAPANSSALVSRMSAGSHTALLTNVPPNCTVAGSNPVVVSVSNGETVIVSFIVSCGYATAAIAVSAATTGNDLPTADYQLRRGGDPAGVLEPNGTVVLEGVAAGSHDVELLDVPTNCVVDGDNPVTASVTSGGEVRDTAAVAFSVSCASVGTIVVSTTTSGLDVPRRAYALLVDGIPVDSVLTSGSRIIDGFVGGEHAVELTNVPSNCSVAGANPVMATVTTDGTARDTTDVAFDVACTTAWGLAFTRSAWAEGGQAPAIHMARADGSDVAFFAWGSAGAWSPDGSRLVFAACVWSDPYYYYYYYYYPTTCNPSGLSVSGTDSSSVRPITTDVADTDPTWRPDGAKIAFSRRGQLQQIDADGTDLARIPLPLEVRSASQPAWSPDGSTLAFTCEVEATNLDICAVRPDGTGFVRLTDALDREAGPAWRPDGSSIAFTATPSGATSQIALVAPDGSGQTVLSTAIGALRPAWTSDGTSLAFVGVECNIYSGCRTVGLYRVGADGSELTQLTSQADDAPAWRP
jgi:hypothetical protein